MENKRVDITYEKLFAILRSAVKKAKRLEYIKRPLAYALYSVWRHVDKCGIEIEEEE